MEKEASLISNAFLETVLPIVAEPETTQFINSARISLSTDTSETEIHYEYNNFLPLNQQSPLYTSPVVISCSGSQLSCSGTLRAQVITLIITFLIVSNMRIQ
jgi:hypothetical protein